MSWSAFSTLARTDDTRSDFGQKKEGTRPSMDCARASTEQGEANFVLSRSLAALARRCAVVIASCDSYSETWEPYETLFWRFWPTCPFHVYIISNETSVNSPRMLNLRVGRDVSWSDNLIAALGQIPEEYVLVMVDDFFFRSPVASTHVMAILEWMDRVAANCVHLYGRPQPEERTTDLVGPLPKGVYYRASAVSALWRKSVLMEILSPGETAWDFEIRGSTRSDAFDRFYSTLDPCFSFINGIVKGKWDPRSVAALRKLGVAPDCQKRGLLNAKQRAILMLVLIRSQLCCLLPLRMRGKVKAFVLGGRLNYQRHR
jgi:hypothetical protein